MNNDQEPPAEHVPNQQLMEAARESSKKRGLSEPPAGSMFTLSPEDLLARARSWDVAEESRVETQRLLDRLASALEKERFDRATSAAIITQSNKDWAELRTLHEQSRLHVDSLLSENERLRSELAAVTHYRLYKVARAIDQRLRGLFRR